MATDKLTREQVEALQSGGYFNKKDVDNHEKSNQIKDSKRTARLTKMTTEDGKSVIPTLVFRGGRGTIDSKKQTAFRADFRKLAVKYDESTTKNGGKNV